MGRFVQTLGSTTSYVGFTSPSGSKTVVVEYDYYNGVGEIFGFLLSISNTQYGLMNRGSTSGSSANGVTIDGVDVSALHRGDLWNLVHIAKWVRFRLEVTNTGFTVGNAYVFGAWTSSATFSKPCRMKNFKIKYGTQATPDDWDYQSEFGNTDGFFHSNVVMGEEYDFTVAGAKPIAVWSPSMDPAKGTTMLTDLSGNGQNGVLTDMDAATDWVQSGFTALDFQGTDIDLERVVIPVNLNLRVENDYSYSLWFKLRDLIAHPNQIIFTYSLGTNNRVGCGYFIDGLRAGHWDGVSYTSGPRTTYNTENEWIHYAVTRTGPTVKVYFNGVESVESAANPTLSSSQKTLGSSTTIRPFRGLIGDARVFDTVLSERQVLALYNNGNGQGRTSPQRVFQTSF